MTYLISDIHGDLSTFKKLLTKLHFDSTRDEMIIIGDIFDRNPYGIELLTYIAPYLKNQSMKLIIGNHEYFAKLYLKGRLSEAKWSAFGGEATLGVIQNMTQEEKEALLAFIDSLPYYIELDRKMYGKRVVLTHTGIDCDHYVYNTNGDINVVESIKQAVAANAYKYLISIDLHNIPASDLKKLDSYIICGHLCTFHLNEDASSRIYQTSSYTDIDAGAGYREEGGLLACYCPETNETVYM